MIKTFEQAEQVQARRQQSGRIGTAKAVRRFYMRRFPDFAEYKKQLTKLRVNWSKPEKSKVVEAV